MIVFDFHLPDRLRRSVRAVARAILPAEAEQLGLIDRIVDHYEMSLRGLPGHVRLGILAALAGLEATALVHPRTFGRPLPTLSPEDTRKVWRVWSHNPLIPARLMVKGLRAFLVFSFYEQPEIRALLDYDPDAWTAEVIARRDAHYGDDVRRHEARLLDTDPLLPAHRLVRRPASPASAVDSAGTPATTVGAAGTSSPPAPTPGDSDDAPAAQAS